MGSGLRYVLSILDYCPGSSTCLVESSGFRVFNLVLKVSGSRAQETGFGGLGFTGLGFREFRVLGLGLICV